MQNVRSLSVTATHEVFRVAISLLAGEALMKYSYRKLFLFIQGYVLILHCTAGHYQVL